MFEQSWRTSALVICCVACGNSAPAPRDAAPIPDTADAAVAIIDAAPIAAIDVAADMMTSAPPPDVRPVDAGSTVPQAVLIFTRANGFVHDSIGPAAAVLKKALAPLGIAADVSDDPALFAPATLARYGAVVLISTTGTPLGNPGTAQIEALAAFVRGGGGLAGVHAASNGHSESTLFVGLIGGDFIDHPGGVRRGSCHGQGTFPAVTRLPNPFVITDEFYVFIKYRNDNEVDLQCDPVSGGAPLPIAWHRTEGQGRVFYSGLGHGTEEWSDRRLVDDHLVPGILWTLRR